MAYFGFMFVVYISFICFCQKMHVTGFNQTHNDTAIMKDNINTTFTMINNNNLTMLADRHNFTAHDNQQVGEGMIDNNATYFNTNGIKHNLTLNDNWHRINFTMNDNEDNSVTHDPGMKDNSSSNLAMTDNNRNTDEAHKNDNSNAKTDEDDRGTIKMNGTDIVNSNEATDIVYTMDKNGTLSKERRQNDKIPIYVLGLFPMEGQWSGGEALLNAFQIGLEFVNAREDLLHGYHLDIIWNNTKCNPGLGTYVLNKALYEPPLKHMVVGAGCSAVSQATAESSQWWNVIQLSYASSSPALSDKKRFPRFFRVSSPDTAMNNARIEFFKKFGWSRIASIHQSLEIFSAVTDDLVMKLPEHGITLITSEIFTDDPSIQVRNLMAKDARIIIVGCYADKAIKMLCEAYKVRMYGPKYVWFFPGWYNSDYHIDEDLISKTDCTKKQIAAVVEGSFHTGIVHLNPNEDVGLAGITPQQFRKMYDERVEYVSLNGDGLVGQGFDAAWAVALALNRTQQIFEERGDSRSLEDFRYADEEMSNIMYESMKQVQFQGMKGYIFFDENFDHEGMVKFTRNQGGVIEIIAYYRPEETGPEALEWLDNATLDWPGGHPPRDSSVFVNVLVLVPKSVYGAMCSFSTFGILIALCLLAFNVVNRNARLIKMSSPTMNNIILVGCIVGYSAVFIHDTDNNPSLFFCQAKIFVLMTGFSLVFGALFAKTWRVHVIFTNKTKRLIVSDIHLVAIVGVLVLADIIMFTVREIADPQSIEIIAIDVEETGDTVVTNQVAMCKSTYKLYFLGVVYVTKGLLLLFGTFLAWGTRKVTIPALNDSQYIGMCIYNVMILSILGVVLGFVLQEQVTVNYAMTSAFLLLGTTTTQLIIFIPKIMKFKDSKVSDEDATKTNFRANTTVTTLTSENGIGGDVKDIKEENEELKKENAELKNELNAKNQIIDELKSQVGLPAVEEA